MVDFDIDTIKMKRIGIIKTPHYSNVNMPIQPMGAKGIKGVIELLPKYAAGLTDLDGFSHIILIYSFHKQRGYDLSVKPFMDDKEHGIFATRSPKRPSPIGISTVELLTIKDGKIYFDGADMMNNSPLMDIKPFFRQTDNRFNAKSGWLDEKPDDLAEKIYSDARFS